MILLDPNAERTAMHIRSMTAADIPSALALWAASEGIGLSDGDGVDEITGFLVRNPGLSFVASNSADGLIGAVLAGHDGRRGFLYHLAVGASFRRQGVGRLLVEHALDQLRAAGISKCHVMVFRDNEEGRRFWERAGWARRDELDVHSIVITP